MAVSQAATLQEIVQRLHQFWSAQGCTIWHPHSEKVGAGTMNPATFLHVLGPEPWRVGYMEPSFRADDGRYAENPNRMQMHTQYQVILKPDPGNPQELYLASLSVLGLDRASHDIRFVEDNWESPALSAWGLGWEVWLDGQEITQFTYFQQAGGQVLDPVSVEITYGLERIAMFLQGLDEVWSISVDGQHTYAELYRSHEVEHSQYNFDAATVERLHQLNDLYHEEAARCLEQRLIHPAYDYLLRQSHNFNLLDTRGAVGVTERAQYFASMRGQARAVAELYLQERQNLEYPFLQDEIAATISDTEATAVTGLPVESRGTDSLLFEIGIEEFPAHEIPNGIAQLQELMPRLLADRRLAHGSIQVAGTPRRLVVEVQELVLMQPDQIRERRGPSVRVAFHADGTPSKAALGFARGQGIPVARLVQKNDYVYAVTQEQGLSALELLPSILTDLLDGLTWSKTMRWNASGKAFPRPVRWLLALLGSIPVPFVWGGVNARSVTRAPRYTEATDPAAQEVPELVPIESLSAYKCWLQTHDIVLDRATRRETIRQEATAAAAAVGGILGEDPGLLDEVTDLVEAPLALTGTIPVQYLQLPTPVLITVMRKHQRYFSVYQAEGAEELLPYFITIVNGRNLKDPDVIRTGNEHVVNARFADAAFFLKRDMETALAKPAPKLDSLVFHAQLGSMGDKVKRLVALVPAIGTQLDLTRAEMQTAKRAAALCKNDLVTSMVVEMTSLQGIMGELYAREVGEDRTVCQAIREHCLPRSADDEIPVSRPGLVLSLADRLDSLVGLMAAGVRPSGSADPFGLRRLALGLVNALLQSQSRFDLSAGIQAAAQQHVIDITPEIQEEILDFVLRRVRVILLNQQLPHDVVDAIEFCPAQDPVLRMTLACELAEMARNPEWKDSLEAYVRCVRILASDHEPEELGTPVHELSIERELRTAVKQATCRLDQASLSVGAFAGEMKTLEPLVVRFFESVMVLAEDPTERAQRLALMAAIKKLGSRLGDLTLLRTDTV